MSLKPRKTPCIANERRTAGAPSDLNVRYLSAGFSIGESYKDLVFRDYNDAYLITRTNNTDCYEQIFTHFSLLEYTSYIYECDHSAK